MNATKQRIGADDLVAVLRGAREVLVVKGKKSTPFAGAGKRVDDDLRAACIGPTGNLRAPTIRVGNRWLVGFQEEAWTAMLG